jgi:hypothetical protein
MMGNPMRNGRRASGTGQRWMVERGEKWVVGERRERC